MEQIYIALAGLITIFGTGFGTFLFTKAKYKQEVEKLKIEVLQAKNTADTTAIENDIKLSNHYKEILDDLKNRYEDRYNEYEQMMQRKIAMQKEQFNEFEQMMKRKVAMLEEELKLKDRKIKLQQQEIAELKKENRLLKHAKASITQSELV